MRRFTLAFVFIFVVITACITTTGCTDKKAPPTDSTTIDSMQKDSTSADTMEALMIEQPMPKAADELFDDFFFNFAANRKLQRKRIHFPLPVYTDGKVIKTIAKNEWKIDNFFMRQDFYTLIFDNIKQMHVVKDTTSEWLARITRADCRPEKDLIISVPCTGFKFAFLKIYEDGNILIDNRSEISTNWISLDCITFKAKE